MFSCCEKGLAHVGNVSNEEIEVRTPSASHDRGTVADFTSDFLLDWRTVALFAFPVHPEQFEGSFIQWSTAIDKFPPHG